MTPRSVILAAVVFLAGSTAADQDQTVLKGHKESVNAVAFSPDGKLLASGSADDTVKLWEVPSGKHLATLKGHEDSVNGVAISPDGKWLASASSDDTVILWDIATRKRKTKLKGHADAVNAVTF